MKSTKNYIVWTPLITAIIVVIMSLLSLIPPYNFYDIRLKQTNIYSGVVSDSMIRELFGLRYINPEDTTTIENIEIAEVVEIPDTIAPSQEPQQPQQPPQKEQLSRDATFEDYSKNQHYTTTLRQALASDTMQNIRIAFMGDSFIEGDILTMDLREMLQSAYSGGGVGFVPITSQVARYRGTIKHKFSRDWQSACIISEREGQRYLLSGHEYYPAEGSWVEYKPTLFRPHATKINHAKLLFINRGDGEVRVTINDNKPLIFRPKSSEKLQEISLEQDICTIRYEFSSCDKMVIYGALLDYREAEHKVSLDNYSIRGNSGINMRSIDKDLAAQFNAIAPYSLIVIQYGINVSGQDDYSYAKYGRQLHAVVSHIKECYPAAAIAIMGVSDRCTIQDGEPVTMPTITALDNIERQVAQSSEVIYFSTLQVMKKMGGMGAFVSRNWAHKDYTHINTLGGKKVAEEFYKALTGQMEADL